MNLSYHHQHIVTLLSGVPVASELLLRTKPTEVMGILLKTQGTLIERSLELTRAKAMHAKELLGKGSARTIFINYSPWQVENPVFLKCLDVLDELLDMGALVIIEITENSLCESIEALERNAKIARERGYFIAVDDFGAGESNFNALFKLQPSIVKLDSSIIHEAAEHERAKDGFYQLTDLLRNLGFRVVVEGVESSNQLSVARHAQADFAQGFFFHRPEPVISAPSEKGNVIAAFGSAIPAV